jgi:hypothetical protein
MPDLYFYRETTDTYYRETTDTYGFGVFVVDSFTGSAAGV